MARIKKIQALRTTRAALNAQKAASGLLQGEPYLITDESRLAVGTAVNGYADMATKAEVDAKAATAHTHTAAQISDSTAVGRAVLTAATAAAGRNTLFAKTNHQYFTVGSPNNGWLINLNVARTNGNFGWAEIYLHGFVTNIPSVLLLQWYEESVGLSTSSKSMSMGASFGDVKLFTLDGSVCIWIPSTGIYQQLYFSAWGNNKPVTATCTNAPMPTDGVALVHSFANWHAASTSELALSAPLASPALTGTPTAPTAAAGTSTTQLATTAFVQQATAPAPVVVTANTTVVLTGLRAVYACNTQAGSFTLTLPANPAAGTTVKVIDYKSTFAVNNLTVARNGKNILGLAEDYILDVSNHGREFVYIDATMGWSVQ